MNVDHSTLKVIQITDTHLFSDNNLEVFGVKSNLTFKTVIEKIIKEDAHNTDFIFLTGDISQDETEQSYQCAVNCLSPLNIPIYWIPGNHDNPTHIKNIFNNSRNFNCVQKLSCEKWNFIFLDTTVPGRTDGYLSLTKLNSLKNEIEASRNKKIAVVMHHHPISMNTPMIDKYILENNQDFWKMVTNTTVELIICGHVHNDYSLKHNNIAIESGPATCVQFKKGATDLTVENKIGYKIYYFDDNGYRSETKIFENQ